jgi:hypothetical protein
MFTVNLNWFLGLIFVNGSISSSGILNTTFRKIMLLNQVAYGGALVFSSGNYLDFTIDRCTFAECTASSSAAILIDSAGFFFHITRTRFENNTSLVMAIDDVGLSLTCSFTVLHQPLFSSSCCDSPRLRCRVGCNNRCLVELQNSCSDEIVMFFCCFMWFFFVIDFIFFVYFLWFIFYPISAFCICFFDMRLFDSLCYLGMVLWI